MFLIERWKFNENLALCQELFLLFDKLGEKKSKIDINSFVIEDKDNRVLVTKTSICPAFLTFKIKLWMIMEKIPHFLTINI